MDYARPDRAQRLAAEYALGTLRGPARRRFERLLPAHPVLDRALQDWSRRLQLLSTPFEPVTPPERVWAAVQQRLFPTPAPAAVPWWQGLLVWRGLAAASLAALLLLATLPRAPVDQPPTVVILNVTPEGASTLAGGFVASVTADGGALVLKPIVPVKLDTGRALELWAVPAAGAPRSLGLLDNTTGATLRRARLLSGAAALAVSLEPAGGSPTGQPTGPIVSMAKV